MLISSQSHFFFFIVRKHEDAVQATEAESVLFMLLYSQWDKRGISEIFKHNLLNLKIF